MGGLAAADHGGYPPAGAAVESLQIGDRFGALKALREAVEPELSRRRRPPFEVRGAVRRAFELDVAQGRDRAERPQFICVVAQRRRDPRLLLVGRRDRALERPVPDQQLGRRFRPDPRRARQPVRRIATQRDEVGHQARRDPVAGDDLVGINLLEPGRLLLQKHDADPLSRALIHVSVAGHDQRAATRISLDARQRAEQIVGLEVGRGL